MKITRKNLLEIFTYLENVPESYNFSLDVKKDSDGDLIIEFSYRGHASDWLQILQLTYDSRLREYYLSIELYHCALKQRRYIYYRTYTSVTLTTVKNILNDHSSMFGNSYFK